MILQYIGFLGLSIPLARSCSSYLTFMVEYGRYILLSPYHITTSTNTQILHIVDVKYRMHQLTLLSVNVDHILFSLVALCNFLANSKYTCGEHNVYECCDTSFNNMSLSNIKWLVVKRMDDPLYLVATKTMMCLHFGNIYNKSHSPFSPT